MTAGIKTQLHRAITAQLREDAGVAALVGNRIYDEVREDAPTNLYPYLRIREMRFGNDNTDGLIGHIVNMILDIHTRPTATAGRVSVRAISEAVFEALNWKEAEIAARLTGWHVSGVDYLDDSIRREGGKGWNGIEIYEIRVNKLQPEARA